MQLSKDTGSKGLVHLYYGDGKGKTSAAIGLAVRAAGHGKRVLLGRFLKTDDSGEVGILSGIAGITVLPCRKSFGFFSKMDEIQKEEAKRYYQECLNILLSMAVSDAYDVLILDEAVAACNYHLLDEKQLITWISQRPEYLEVVLTGRNPSEELQGLADYLSEVKNRRHPFDAGIEARKGIEF